LPERLVKEIRTLLDRPGLEAAACECYQLLKEELAHFLNLTPAHSG